MTGHQVFSTLHTNSAIGVIPRLLDIGVKPEILAGNLIGVIAQAVMGYFNFEIGLYIKGLYGVAMIDYILLCFLAFVVHAIVNNKYLGHFVMILYYLFNMFMSGLGLEHNLYDFSSDPGIMYSDMNAYGHFVWPFITYKVYWFSFVIILAFTCLYIAWYWFEGWYKIRVNFLLGTLRKKSKFDTKFKL